MDCTFISEVRLEFVPTLFYKKEMVPLDLPSQITLIEHEQEIIHLKDQLQLSAIETAELLRIFLFTQQYRMQLFHCPMNSQKDMFYISLPHDDVSLPRQVYFCHDQFSLLDVILRMTDQAFKLQAAEQHDQLLTKLERQLEQRLRDYGVKDLVKGENYLQYMGLRHRALNVDNDVVMRNEQYVYIRNRHRVPYPGHGCYFTSRDAHYRRRRHVGGKWYFGLDELPALEEFIAHDEKIYRQYYPKKTEKEGS